MTVVRELRARALRIPFKTAFRHAAAERSVTATAWVEAVGADGTIGYGEACPRPYVTGETVDSALAFVAAHAGDVTRRVGSVDALRQWMVANHIVIDQNPAAWCAIELALLDLFAKNGGQSVEAMLDLPASRGPFRFTAVLGDMGPQAFAAMAAQYRARGFADFKIKLSSDADADRAKVETMRGLDASGLRVRADANNLWADADDAISSIRALNYPVFAVEEPIAADRYDDLARIGEAVTCRIVLDESLVRVDQLALLPGPPSRWIANVRVSKMGGLLRSLDVVREARARGVGVIVGAQVGETSLLTRVGLSVASAAGPDLVAHEGAFGTHLLQYDVCDPPLMFGAGGILNPPDTMFEAPGFGVRMLPGVR